MKKRTIALFMAMTLGITSFSACGAKNESVVCVDNAATESEALYPYEAASESKAAYCYDYEYNVEYSEEPMHETYEILEESGFFNVKKSPLSTFAADVDTASYANMRRFVNSGYSLYDFANVSIRAEEMINYFKYDYKAPENGERFGVSAVLSDCPWNRENVLMVLGINTKALTEGKRPDSNIVFLIDISGSMNSENKLPLLKSSMELLLENLTKNDRVSIVTYANGTNVVLDGVAGNETRKIKRAFSDLSAGGGTNGEGGIELAYEIASENFIEDGNNRIILATDGDFNIGICRGDDLKDLISEKKETGVFLSVLGFGMGNYNDVTAETLADYGNGNYSYIDNLTEAKKVLVDEFGSTIYTVAKDTKFQVEFNPAMVSEYRLIGYENRFLNAEDFKDDTKDGGEIGAGHQVTAIYELTLEDNEKDGTLKYQSNTSEWCTLSIAYKDPDKDSSEYREFPIGVENFTQNPSKDFMLATSVAEYAMALNNSEYLADLSREEALEQAIKNVEKLDSDDDLVIELLELMEKVSAGETKPKWYE